MSTTYWHAYHLKLTKGQIEVQSSFREPPNVTLVKHLIQYVKLYLIIRIQKSMRELIHNRLLELKPPKFGNFESRFELTIKVLDL